jgi:hypothetical protein
MILPLDHPIFFPHTPSLTLPLTKGEGRGRGPLPRRKGYEKGVKTVGEGESDGSPRPHLRPGGWP